MSGCARRALLFAPHFPPHGNSEAIAAGKLALALSRRGWLVDVVASRPRGAGELEAIWAPLADSVHAAPAEGLGPVRVLAARLHALARTGHAVRGMAWASGALRLAQGLVRRQRYELILSRSQPLAGHLPALALARGCGLPWIATWNDIEPAERAPGPYGEGLQARADRGSERLVAAVSREASYHFFPCEAALRYQQRLTPAIGGRAGVAPHCALDGLAAGAGEPTARPAELTICHAGTFDRHRDPRAFLEAVGRLLERRPDLPLRLLALGEAPDGPFGRGLPRGLRARVELRERVGYAATLSALRGADALLLVEADAAEPVWLAGKLADYAQCGRPLLALTPTGSAADALIGAHGGGERAAPGDGAGVAAALSRLVEAWERGALAERYPTRELQRSIGEAEVAARYAAVAARLCGGGRR